MQNTTITAQAVTPSPAEAESIKSRSEKPSRFFLKKLSLSRKVAYTAALLLMIFIFDISRMPQKQLTSKMLLFSIHQYQKFISPRLRGIITCKFQPTCSHYGETVIRWYGAYWGTIYTAQRLWRCSPWSDRSGWDPP